MKKAALKKTLHREHHHEHQPHQGKRPHPLAHFFGCCLKDEPTPVSDKIQALRRQKLAGEIKFTKVVPGKSLTIKPNMIVGDLINTFPAIKTYLEDIHPLGLMSPTLDRTTLEIFLADLAPDLKSICQTLTELTKQS